jgi:DNA helicase-2/ATP-dependent DNA helicase PcrA
LTDADEDVFGSGTAPIAAARGGAGLWAAASAGGLAAEREHAAAAAPRFRIGEDVAHATFGEGVVTGLEPGGIVVVRFAADGSERKLLAGIAPVRSR